MPETPRQPLATDAEATLRPDPTGDSDPYAPKGRAGDFTLHPDPAGVHDPIRGDVHASQSVRDDLDGVGERIEQAAQASRSHLSGLADHARARAEDLDDQTQERVGAIHRRHMRRIDDLTVQGVEGLSRGRRATERFVEENPLLVGVVGVAAGLLLGALLPRTRQEDRSFGPYADEVRDQGLRYAREMTHRGREFVETALDPDNVGAAARKSFAESADESPPKA